MRCENWTIDPEKYLPKEDANRLLTVARKRADKAYRRNRKVAIRDYFMVHLAIATGLRVMEIAQLQCRDVYLSEETPAVLVRQGKGGKRRIVYMTEPFRLHCLRYLHWKKQTGESVEPQSPLLLSSSTGKHMTTRALQKAFKRCAQNAGLSTTYSIHSLRHTYACCLLKSSGNIRLVQKQLGHSRITTTQVYADVMVADVLKAVGRMGW